MVETPIQGTSLLILLIHVSYTYTTVNHWKPAFASFADQLPCEKTELLDLYYGREGMYLWLPLMLNCHAEQASAGRAASGSTTANEPDSRKDAETRDTMMFLSELVLSLVCSFG